MQAKTSVNVSNTRTTRTCYHRSPASSDMRYALDTVLEELQAAGRGEVVMAEGGRVAVLEELKAVRELRLLDRGGRVAELLHELGDEHELGRERVPRAMPVHLHKEDT